MRIERDKEMILVKYQDFTLITIRIYVELRIYELSLLTLLIKTLPAPSSRDEESKFWSLPFLPFFKVSALVLYAVRGCCSLS